MSLAHRIHLAAFPPASERSVGLPRASTKAHLTHCTGYERAVGGLEADLSLCP